MVIQLGEEYYREVYGEPLTGYSNCNDFGGEKEFYTDYGLGNYNKFKEVDLQVNTTGEIDPKLLPFHLRIRYYIREFCYSTSAHGVPWILRAKNNIWRSVWVLLYLFCFGMFWVQAYKVVLKFQKNEKIVDIELKFEVAPFPAVTLCNLNPYKQSMSGSNELVAKTMGAFSDAMGSAGEKKEAKEKEEMQGHKRRKRMSDQHGDMIFELAETKCNCEGEECLAAGLERLVPNAGDPTCLCAFDRHSEEAWPCEKKPTWYEGKCKSCDGHMTCKDRTEGDDFQEYCYCTTYMGREFCIAHMKGSDHLKLWEYYGAPKPTEDPNFLEAMGFADMTDEIAIVTKAKENLVFAMASLDVETRRRMSSRLDEFVHKCSFNGKQCDIEKIACIIVCECFRIYGNDRGRGSQRMIDRLPAPFGNCIRDGKTDTYIYRGYGYSTEGCYRSCFQNMVTRDCGCGDPRFPTVADSFHCLAVDPIARRCLARVTKVMGSLDYKCICQQSCKQSTFAVSYSASKWPSRALKMKLDACNASMDCVEHYKENGAMVEVFYEQLNYESLLESQAYGWVNALADFGGQLGLWLGMSVITCFEAAMLVWDLIWLTTRHYYREWQLKKLQKMKEKGLL